MHHRVIHDDLRTGTAVAADLGIFVAGIINGHALGNAVPQEGCGIEMFTGHTTGLRQRHHAGIGIQILEVDGLFHRLAGIPGSGLHLRQQPLGRIRHRTFGGSLICHRGCSGFWGRCRSLFGSALRCGRRLFRLMPLEPEEPGHCAKQGHNNQQRNHRLAAAALVFHFFSVVIVIGHNTEFSHHKMRSGRMVHRTWKYYTSFSVPCARAKALPFHLLQKCNDETNA